MVEVGRAPGSLFKYVTLISEIVKKEIDVFNKHEYFLMSQTRSHYFIFTGSQELRESLNSTKEGHLCT